MKIHLFAEVFGIRHNVLGLGEVADYEAQMFSFVQMFIRIPTVQFSTEPAILPNCCWWQFLLSVVFFKFINMFK
jgi:hypothetical protein